MTELPTNWGWATLGEFLSWIEAGKSFKCSERPPLANEIGVVKVSAVTWGRYQERESKTCQRGDLVRPELFIRPGDFLFSRANTIDLVGACVIATDVTRDVMLSDKILRFHFTEVEPQWVLWWLRSPVGLVEIRSLATGNQESMRNIGQAKIRQIRLPLCAANERAAIVEEAEKQISRIEAAVAGLKRVQANLERYRASVLKAAVEGRLVPTEAELARQEGRDYEPASVLLERILVERRRRWEEAELAKMKAKGQTPKDDKWKTKYSQPAAPDTDGLPELPEGWCWATTEQIATHLTSGARDWRPYYDRGRSVFVLAQNVRPGKLDLSTVQYVDPPVNDASCERARVRKGDILITIAGANTGDVCVVPNEVEDHFVCQSVALLRLCSQVFTEYVGLYLNAPQGQALYAGYAYGQGRPHLGFDDIEATPIPLPPYTEQIRIADAVDAAIQANDQLNLSVVLGMRKCSQLRQSILKWAFEGKLVDQDPTDESASVRLDRIRAERTPAPATAKKKPSRKPAKKT